MSFSSLGLCDELLKAVAEQGYTTPSPIQEQGIPAVLTGRDIMAAAQTGTGKTASFTLPMVQLLAAGDHPKPKQVRALVLTPTRELAAQVEESVKNYARHLRIRSTVVFGGVKIGAQINKLQGGVDVLVATPGRLIDLYNQQAVKFDHLEVLVLDEADRMLDMGFIHDIRRIQKFLPQKRQTLMFSATFSKEIKALAKGMINSPVFVEVAAANTTAETINQRVHPVDKSRKRELLTKLINENDWHQVLVFSRTKHGANRLAKQLGAGGIPSAAIHGDKSQGARTRALAEFKAGKVSVLVATDIAARGIDIDQLPYVVNFDLPQVPEDYVHRIGRTGRAGANGLAVSLVSADEFKMLHAIERVISRKIEHTIVEGFAPNEKHSPSTESERPKQNQGRRPSGGQVRRRNSLRGGNRASSSQRG